MVATFSDLTSCATNPSSSTLSTRVQSLAVDRSGFLRSRPRQSPRYPYFSPVFPVDVNKPRGPLFGRQTAIAASLPTSFATRRELPPSRIFDVSLSAQSHLHLPPLLLVHHEHLSTSLRFSPDLPGDDVLGTLPSQTRCLCRQSFSV